VYIPWYVYTKTFWAGVASIIAAVGGYFTGELTAAQALPIISTGIIGIFLRNGMANETKKVTDNSDANRDCK
jgi:hypothetical protein